MTGALLIAIVLSVLSAIAYAVAAVAQERLAASSGATSGTTSLLTSVRGWAAVCLNALGALLHAAALVYASLTVVQPLGALSLVVALPVGAALAGRRVNGREWRGAAATVVGLVGVLLAANTGTPSHALSDPQTVLLLAISGAVIFLLARPRRVAGGFPGLRLAFAGGAAFAVGSVLTQTVLLRMGDGIAALMDPVFGIAVVAVAALSIGGLLLSQAAYKHGLGAPLAALTIVNPVVAAAVGIGLLGQGSGLSASNIGTALFAAAVAAVGVVLLATPDGGRTGGEPRSRRPARARAPRARTRPHRAAVARCAEVVHGRRHPAAAAAAAAAVASALAPIPPVSFNPATITPVPITPAEPDPSRRGPLGVS